MKASDRNGDTSTVTVKTDDSTVYRDRVSGKVGDLRSGDTVIVVGSARNGSIAATTIREGDGAGGGLAAGTITKIDSGTLTVKTMEGHSVKVTTSGDTDVVTTEEIGLSDLAEGDTVRVVGRTDGDTVTARLVVRGQWGDVHHH